MKIKFSVEMCEDEVVDAYIDLIKKESLPLSFSDCKSFNVLASAIFEGLKISKINSKNTMDFVIGKYNNIKIS